MENLQPNKKDLSSICERLMRKQLNAQQVDKRSSEDVTIELTSVETTQKAVYQSVINGRVKTSNMNIQVGFVLNFLLVYLYFIANFINT